MQQITLWRCGTLCSRCLNIKDKNFLPLTPILYKRSLSTHVASCNAVRKEISKHVSSRGSESFGQKVKETTKTTYYTAVVLAGFGALGLMGYAIFKELLSSFSPQSVYSAAVDKCTAHDRICELLGESVKSYGEESRRGRRQHISHMPYEVEGVKGFRIKFHLKGLSRTATVHLDARENGISWDFRYLYVQLDSYPHEVVVIEDNRGGKHTTAASTSMQIPDDKLAALPPAPQIETTSTLTPLFPFK